MLVNMIIVALIGAMAGAILHWGGTAIYERLKPKPDTAVYVQQSSDSLIIFASNLGKATDRVKIEVSTKPYTITDYMELVFC